MAGASVRAAAQSAQRAGLQPWAVDLFADRDLRRLGPAQAIPAAAYPRGLIDVIRQAPPGPWLYTGGLENYPDIVDEISRDRLLWGNSGDVLRRVRSPAEVTRALTNAGLPAAAVLLEKPAEPPPGEWLIKRVRGTGGKGIEPWQGQDVPAGSYLQQRMPGDTCAAIFNVHPQLGTRFIGLTHQLVGLPWLHARPFQYCGSIGPLAISLAVQGQVNAIAAALVEAFGLRGLFGLDLVHSGTDFFLVDVNPRYTASVELLERAMDFPMLWIQAACFGTVLPKPAMSQPPERSYAKAILFARAQLVFPDSGPWQDPANKSFADVPLPGTVIDAGQPIFTIFVHADSAERAAKLLQEKALALDQRLFA